MVKLLLAHGADREARTENLSQTALDVASRLGSAESVTLLKP